MKYLKHFIIYLLSFLINYIIFILFINFVNINNGVGVQILNLISWISSMLFIYFIDKLVVPDLVNENNSKELYQFILIRILSLIIEAMILYIFVMVFRMDAIKVKFISLIMLFIFNHFYVSRVKFN